nr:MAG TPA: hypothetical protein [Caudoviricetes sp.]
MKISELIKALQALKRKHGDQTVYYITHDQGGVVLEEVWPASIEMITSRTRIAKGKQGVIIGDAGMPC